MDRGKNWLQSLAADENLHAELIPGIPVVEICDRSRVLIENHQGILAYGCREIQVRVRTGRICVCGENLKLSRMSKGKLVIAGNIRSVNLMGR